MAMNNVQDQCVSAGGGKGGERESGRLGMDCKYSVAKPGALGIFLDKNKIRKGDGALCRARLLFH